MNRVALFLIVVCLAIGIVCWLVRNWVLLARRLSHCERVSAWTAHGWAIFFTAGYVFSSMLLLPGILMYGEKDGGVAMVLGALGWLVFFSLQKYTQSWYQRGEHLIRLALQEMELPTKSSPWLVPLMMLGVGYWLGHKRDHNDT